MSSPSVRPLTALALTVALAGAVTGCGSSDGSSSAGASGTGAATAGANASSNPAVVDAAFVREMTAHHQLAVSMGTIAKHRAKNVTVRALATRIVRVQNGEIKELQAAAARLKVKLTTASPNMTTMNADAASLGISPTQFGMSMSISSLRQAKNFDETFLAEMIPHHAGAINMARAELAHGGDAKLKSLAQRIVVEQTPEMVEMAKLRNTVAAG
jgi:uncharacterized protein (DUF305 family)